ncbi:class II aldolase/adducin family protein [Streptomyces sp. NPDC002073]
MTTTSALQPLTDQRQEDAPGLDLILRHHGLLTVGQSVAEAAWWFIAMDRACQMQLLAESAGNPRHMSHEQADVAHRQFSNGNMARHNFKLLADLVCEQEPDILH